MDILLILCMDIVLFHPKNGGSLGNKWFMTSINISDSFYQDIPTG